MVQGELKRECHPIKEQTKSRKLNVEVSVLWQTSIGTNVAAPFFSFSPIIFVVAVILAFSLSSPLSKTS